MDITTFLNGFYLKIPYIKKIRKKNLVRKTNSRWEDMCNKSLWVLRITVYPFALCVNG